MAVSLKGRWLGDTTRLPAQAELLGGNLTVLASTLGGPLWQNQPGRFVLCLEDIDEEPYQVDRALMALKGAGVLKRAVAVVWGDFTGCEKPEEPVSELHHVEQGVIETGSCGTGMSRPKNRSVENTEVFARQGGFAPDGGELIKSRRDFINRPKVKFGPEFEDVFRHRILSLGVPVLRTDHFGHGAHQGLLPLGVKVALGRKKTGLELRMEGVRAKSS